MSIDYHVTAVADVARSLDTSPSGLDSETALQRLTAQTIFADGMGWLILWVGLLIGVVMANKPMLGALALADALQLLIIRIVNVPAIRVP